MSGLARTLKKITPKEDILLHSAFKNDEKMGKKLEKSIVPKVKMPEKGPVIPLPDEEELSKISRRRAAPRGGRVATFLSEDERLGP